jgi:cation diffusion facilitator family transporter
MDADTALAEREKNRVAMTSLLAAVALTGTKIVIGLATGSLGILAEAAHSGLDLVAAAMTCLAVRWASKPADHEHPFGHAKFETLSAFLEAILLLLTCVWIVWSAVHRMVASKVEVEVNAWAFAVILFSIVVDYSRSRALKRVAAKYKSQALEADALHFETDIWSSLAVLVGLGCVLLGEKVPSLAMLKHGDSVAALAVAFIAGGVTWRLTMRTVRDLVDRAPAAAEVKVRQIVDGVPGVAQCHRIRVRVAGAETFVDLHIEIAGNPSLEDSHRTTDVVEAAIRAEFPGADVMVHAEPAEEL